MSKRASIYYGDKIDIHVYLAPNNKYYIEIASEG